MCLHVCVPALVCLHVRVPACVHMCMPAFVCLHVCRVCACVCARMRARVCAYVCVNVCVQLCADAMVSFDDNMCSKSVVALLSEVFSVCCLCFESRRAVLV